MINENTPLNLYEKLLEIQKYVSGLKKDAKSFGYEYVSGTKILSYIKPKMNELGLLLKQEVLSIENTRQDYQTKNGAKSEILSKVMMRFTWIDVATGDKDENLFGANGQNDWEKGLGSALTYAERYFLLKYFHIATDEDDIDNDQRKTSPPILEKPIEKPIENKDRKQITDIAAVKKLLLVIDKRDKTISQLSKQYSITLAQTVELNLSKEEIELMTIK